MRMPDTEGIYPVFIISLTLNADTLIQTTYPMICIKKHLPEPKVMIVDQPRYAFSSLLLEECFSLLNAFSLICRTLSLVRSNMSPISSRV